MQQRPDIRIYGTTPFRAAVIHGGPGAPGYMAPVARELAEIVGVIEPFQTKHSLDGQIEELHEQICSMSREPLVLIGSSWGAVLALLTEACYPKIASKLILIGSAVFDAESSRKVKAIQLQRIPKDKLLKVEHLEKEMTDAIGKEKNRILGLIAELELDSVLYEPLTRNLELIDTQVDINESVWKDFVRLRDKAGELKRVLSNVQCETLLIHGDYDTHIIDGIHPFLKSCLPAVRLEWLENCGHYPWIEKAAKDRFFKILTRELN